MEPSSTISARWGAGVSNLRKIPFGRTAALKTFVLGVGVWLVLGGSLPAQADEVATSCSTKITTGWTISNPSLDDQRKITDLLSLYAWTIDEWDVKSFVALFDQSDPQAYYELCNAGGSNQVFKLFLKNSQPSIDLETQMTSIISDLQGQHLKTRHMITNTLFNIDSKTNTITTKSTLLVTIQAATLAEPALDYSADVRATYVNRDGTWRLKDLTVYADNAAVMEKKR